MNSETLWYRKPARGYIHAMPVGNGRLGAMVLGGVTSERINLNEDTLWSGFPRTNAITNAYERYTRRIRQKILKEDDMYGAEDLADKLQGPYNESYLSAGEFVLHFAHSPDVKDYRRGLDMRRAVAFVEYECDGVSYRREVLACAPDDVLAVRLTASKRGALTFTGTLESLIRHTTRAEGERFSLFGRAPRHVEPLYLERDYGDPQAIVYDEVWEGTKGLRFETLAEICPIGGSLKTDEHGFCVTGADECVIYLWIGTNFNHERFSCDSLGLAYSIEDMDLDGRAKEAIRHAKRDGFEALYRRHIADAQSYFDRASLSLDADPALNDLPTDERKARYDGGASDVGLEQQAFDFGRYLLYSSSREGTQAANLQGIWCWQIRPQWSCNYTVNINTQMNYWGVEVLNMPECHLPLIAMIDELTHTGAVTAKSLYNARGFCTHHNTDLWRSACPIGMGETDCKWSLFVSGGIWLALHVYEHYCFTRDREFLRRYFHILKGAALFALDMMCDIGGGYLGMCPTTVPERRFYRNDGVSFSVGAGSTLDYELVGELFCAVRSALRDLSLDEKELLCEIDEAQKKFPPLPIKDGTLQFWQTEAVPEEYMWVNVLFGLYPGHSLCPTDEEMMRVARKTMEEQDVRTGAFSNAWSAGIWARLRDGERAYSLLRYHLTNAMEDSLLGLNRNGGKDIFQIDSNLGLIATVAETLLYSDERKISLLAALPREWKSGSMRDFKTRCGCTVSLVWKDLRITELSISSRNAITLDVELCDRERMLSVSLEAGETIHLIKDGEIHEKQ